MAKKQLTPCAYSKCNKEYERRNKWHETCSTQCAKDYFREIQQKRAEYDKARADKKD